MQYFPNHKLYRGRVLFFVVVVVVLKVPANDNSQRLYLSFFHCLLLSCCVCVYSCFKRICLFRLVDKALYFSTLSFNAGFCLMTVQERSGE